MKLNLLFLLSFIFSMAIAQQRDTTYSFMMQPIDTTKAPEMRFYTVAIPSGYNAQTPASLILNLHGFYDPISTYRTTLSMDSIAEANNAIMVYPQGDTCTWVYKPLSFLPNSGNGWNAGIIQGDFDDVDFISRVIDSIKLDYNINHNQVFCMGVSNGGFMTAKLAATFGHTKFAAAASIIGFDSLSPTNLIPFMTILGERDTIARYNGIAGIYPSWPSLRSKWLSNSNCSSNYIADTLADLDPNDNSWVEKRTYSGCTIISGYVEYLIKNGGHNVPNTGVCSAPPVVCNALGPINNDIDPSVEIWNFYRNYSIVSLDENSSRPLQKVYPNPSSDQVQFEFPLLEKVGRIEIFNIQGKRVFERKLAKGMDRYSWNSNSFEAGIYIYQLEINGKELSGKIQLISPH